MGNPVSRQNKQVKRNILAAEITRLHKAGDRGPAKTAPKKRAGRHKDPDRQAARAEALNEMRKRIADTVRKRWGRSATVTQW